MCLTCHVSEKNKVYHILGNLVCKGNCNWLEIIWNDLSTSIFFTFDSCTW